jgi:hypothetical protein
MLMFFGQCCESGMFIPDPDFYPSRIPDPRSRIPDPKQQQKRGVKKNLSYFLCSHKFHKNENYFSFEVLKKKIWANFQRIIELFTQKIVTQLSKIWVWDPRSGIRKKPIPDPGVKKAPDPDPQHFPSVEDPDPCRFGSLDPHPDPHQRDVDQQHWFFYLHCMAR